MHIFPPSHQSPTILFGYMDKSKILVLYPDPAGIDKVIATANTQNSKNGPFDAAVFLGLAIPETAPETVPEIPIYFFGAEGELLEDIGPNFTCVRKQWAIVRLQSGVTMGFWNEKAKNEASEEALETLEDEETLQKEEAQFGDMDILFTHHWARAVGATQQLMLVGNKKVDSVVQATRPRYHFAVGSETGRFYEHGLFAWSKSRTCRFVSLGRQNSAQRWFYAFFIDKIAGVESAVAENPFRKVKKAEEEEMGKRPRAEPEQRMTENGSMAKRPRIAPLSCFFCLSNPKFEAHMVVSVGEHSYLTIAKGPLPRPHKTLNMTGHAIIIPIAHEATIDPSSKAFQEMEDFQRRLATAFSAHAMATVFFDIARPENVHYHMQMVPIPLSADLAASLAEKTRDNDKFERNQRLVFKEYAGADLASILQTGRYVRFIVYKGEEPVHYVAPLEGEKSLDLQFPRRVLAHVLHVPKRIYWDKCRQTKAQETQECETYKSFFEQY